GLNRTKGSGKTSTLNTILSRESSQRVRRTAQCVVGTGVVGRTVAVLDTPGCFSITSDLLVASCAILLVVNVSTPNTHTIQGGMTAEHVKNG
uniref:AIG1-type G domain-containing protein n=1 Tax=Sander lucioperca TaxID=283035 RepID=A0A8C9XPV6_SANLU